MSDGKLVDLTFSRRLAQQIVKALLNERDIENATHGNYDAETFRRRIGEQWVNTVEAIIGPMRVAIKHGDVVITPLPCEPPLSGESPPSSTTPNGTQA